RIVQDAVGCQLLRLNDTDDGDEAPLERLPDGAPDPQAAALDDSMRRAIVEALQELPERERLVLSLYYEQELNLKEIGAVLKVTESRVCQLHGQALLRLKSRLGDWQTEGGRRGRAQHTRLGAGLRRDRARCGTQRRRRTRAGFGRGLHDRRGRHRGRNLHTNAAGRHEAGLEPAAVGVSAAGASARADREENSRLEQHLASPGPVGPGASD